MTETEIRKAFEATLGIQPRIADIMVAGAMGDTVEALAEYIWDHWMGEPESPTLEEVEQRIREAIV